MRPFFNSQDEFEKWLLWMDDVTDADTKSTWYSWNKGQLENPRNEHGTQTNPLTNRFMGVLSSAPMAILAVAAVNNMESTVINK